MKLLIVSIALLAVSGVFLLRKLVRFRKHPAGSGKVSMIIIVKDQEQWIEGFVRKLFNKIKCLPQSRVLFINDGSSDNMLEVLSCLQKHYPFELLSVTESKSDILKLVDRDRLGPILLKFDARGLKGKDLLCAPLFSHLNRLIAGKFYVMSK